MTRQLEPYEYVGFRLVQNRESGHDGLVLGWVGQFWRRWFSRRPRGPARASDTLVQRVQTLGAHQEQRMLRVAEEALRRGHPEQAIIAYQKAAARFRLLGQRLKQLAVLQHLVRLQPGNPEPLRALVSVYEELERHKEAFAARARLARVLYDRGDVAGAQEVEHALHADMHPLEGLPRRTDAEVPVVRVEEELPFEMPGEPMAPGADEGSPILDLDIEVEDGHTPDKLGTSPMTPPVVPATHRRPDPSTGLGLGDLAVFENTWQEDAVREDSEPLAPRQASVTPARPLEEADATDLLPVISKANAAQRAQRAKAGAPALPDRAPLITQAQRELGGAISKWPADTIATPRVEIEDLRDATADLDDASDASIDSVGIPAEPTLAMPVVEASEADAEDQTLSAITAADEVEPTVALGSDLSIAPADTELAALPSREAIAEATLRDQDRLTSVLTGPTAPTDGKRVRPRRAPPDEKTRTYGEEEIAVLQAFRDDQDR